MQKSVNALFHLMNTPSLRTGEVEYLRFGYFKSIKMHGVQRI